MPSKEAKALMDHVNSVMGKNTIRMASDPFYEVTYLPTEVGPIDDLFGGGIPFGRFIELFGNYSTLKSWVGLKAIASCQDKGGLAAIIDTEHAFDPKWAKECGVDLDNLIIKHPDSAEQAMDVCEVLIRGGVNLIVFDSIAAALPKAEKETMLSGDRNIQPARLASLMSIAMRKLTTANNKTAMIWINQTRINVGMMFGNPETTPGGKAMGFFASMRCALRKAGAVTEPVSVHVMEKGTIKKKTINRTVAQSVRATLEKSKLNAPHRDVLFQFDHRTGEVDEWQYLATQCLDVGAIEYNRGVWEVCEGKNKGQKARGKEAFQKVMPERELLKLLGRSQPAPSKVVKLRKSGSNGKARVVIQTRVRAGSKTTAATKTTSTKSKTPRKVTKSKPKK